MNFPRPAVVPALLLPCFMLLPVSCNTKDNMLQAKSLNDKAEQLHKEADQLAGEASLVQAKIRNLGGEGETGPKVLANLELRRSELMEEQKRLTEIGAGLTEAIGKLGREREAYSAKYTKP
ncbi:MAG: hypothetical protein JWL81_1604 [Verrucomicrobiales bacterium]|nr:hypothetical protein [Verrucomicrobiales bacterium]